MSHLSDFLFFCAGSDRELLKKCATPEVAKHQSVGATVVFTAFFAMLSGGYALSTVFNETMLVLFLALIWGLFIFNLDRYIVSSMVTQNSFWNDLKLAIPRLILAVLLALVISTPLELKIFENKINMQLEIDAQWIYKEQEESIRQKNIPERKKLEKRRLEIEPYKKELDKEEQKLKGLKKNWGEKEALANRELLGDKEEGIRPGPGGRYKEFKKQAVDAKVKYNKQSKVVEQKQRIISELEGRLNANKAELDQREKQEIEKIKNERGDYKGFVERFEAFSNLKSGSETAWYIYFFITLLFIAIETAPIFVKILSIKGTYDKLLEEKNNKIIENSINPTPPPIAKNTMVDKWQQQYEETIKQNISKSTD